MKYNFKYVWQIKKNILEKQAYAASKQGSVLLVTTWNNVDTVAKSLSKVCF